MSSDQQRGAHDLQPAPPRWRDNCFAHHLLAELLGSAFVGVDEREAGQTLHLHGGSLGPAVHDLILLERQHQRRQRTHGTTAPPTTDDDDLFAFVSLGDGDDDGEESTEQQAGHSGHEETGQEEQQMHQVDVASIPRDVSSFVAATSDLQATAFLSAEAGAHEARRALFVDLERLHQEASPEALALVGRFLDVLRGFVEKTGPAGGAHPPAVRPHPTHFRRILLTSSPACGSSDDGDDADHDVARADANLLEGLLGLAFSFSDETRIRAVELLLMLARVPAPRQPALPLSRCLVERPTMLQVKTTALAIYDAAYAVDRWAPALGPHTFYTLSFPMKLSEAEALVHHYQALHLGTQLLQQHVRVLEELETRLDALIQAPPFGGRAFVKISTRSPKDVVFHLPKFEALRRQVTEEWRARYGLPDPMPESVEQAIMQRCGALCLSVSSGAEAVEMLKTSKRIWVDLKEALDTPSNDFAIQIVVREWLDIPNVFELRGFVRNRRLTALSQYFSQCFFPWVSMPEWISVKERVLTFFESTIAGRLPVEDCVCDFVVCEDRVLVIELNLFGRTAGAALFSWDADQQVLYGNRPFEFRVVADAELAHTAV